MSLRIGTILPHTKLYGGVKRFLELGNIFFEKGHRPIIFTPDGLKPTWFNYKGDVVNFEHLPLQKLDAIFFTEPEFLPQALSSPAFRKIFYFINPKESLRSFKKHCEIEIFANSFGLVNIAKKRFGYDAFPAFGGINLKNHNPKPNNDRDTDSPFVVMAYGRLARGVKGTKYVVRACKRLVRRGYKVELLLFDTPVTEKMLKRNSEFKTSIPYTFIQNHPVDKNQDLYHKADVFVAAEGKAGWSNTAAEAMACGIPVIGTTAGTGNFLFHNETGLVVSQNSRQIANAIEQLINNESLREQLAHNGRKKIEEFDWEILADTIIQNLNRKKLETIPNP